MALDFLVRRDELERCRVAEADPVSLEPGQALLEELREVVRARGNLPT